MNSNLINKGSSGYILPAIIKKDGNFENIEN